MIEKLKSKKIVFDGKVIKVRKDTVILPNKKTATREFIEHPGAVAVIPFIDKNTVLMLRQYRHPIKEITWEIPAGKFDGNESRLNCIKRELSEETGMQAKVFKHLLSFWPTAAFSTEIIHVFAAWKLYPSKSEPDEDEFLETEVVKLDTLYKWIYEGKIKDSKTIIALLAWKSIKKEAKF